MYNPTILYADDGMSLAQAALWVLVNQRESKT